MIAKLGFVLLFVALGIAALYLVIFAPGDARGRLPGIEQMLATPASAPRTSAPQPMKAAPQAAEKPPVAGAATSKTRHTVQLGMFVDQEHADALTAQASALGMPGVEVRTLAIRDRAGLDWWITAAGDQESPEALASAREWFSERLALGNPRVIALPETSSALPPAPPQR